METRELSRAEKAALKRLEKNIAPERRKLESINKKIEALEREKGEVLQRMQGTLNLIETYQKKEELEISTVEDSPVGDMLLETNENNSEEAFNEVVPNPFN